MCMECSLVSSHFVGFSYLFLVCVSVGNWERKEIKLLKIPSLCRKLQIALKGQSYFIQTVLFQGLMRQMLVKSYEETMHIQKAVVLSRRFKISNPYWWSRDQTVVKDHQLINWKIKIIVNFSFLLLHNLKCPRLSVHFPPQVATLV